MTQYLSVLRTRDDREIPGGEERIAFSAATDVDREDWGLTANVALETGGVLVGKRVRIELNVHAVATPRT